MIEPRNLSANLASKTLSLILLVSIVTLVLVLVMVAPNDYSNSKDRSTSSISGIFLIVIGFLDSMEAGIIFKAEFLAPLTNISPDNLAPPLIRNFGIIVLINFMSA